MLDRDPLKQHILQRIDDYSNLNIGGKKIVAPYYIANYQMSLIAALKEAGVTDEMIGGLKENTADHSLHYAYFSGKGTPQQIVTAVEHLAEYYEVDLSQSSESWIRNFMLFCGIGVDCSGFVYEIFRYGFEEQGHVDEFNNSLSWAQPVVIKPTRAGTFIFGGESSEIVEPGEVRDMDHILFYSEDGVTEHIGIVIESDEQYYMVHSTFSRRIQVLHGALLLLQIQGSLSRWRDRMVRAMQMLLPMVGLR